MENPIRNFQEVIQKLQSPKSVKEVLEEQINISIKSHQRSNFALLLSAFAAGLEVGFSVFLMGVIYTLFQDSFTEHTLHFFLAFAYPIGFIFVIIGKSELFTEHTTLAILPVFNNGVTLKALGKLWGLIYAGNLIGGYFFGFIVTAVGPEMGSIDLKAFEYLAKKMVAHSWWIIIASGILAGWLMGLLSWLIASSQDTISRIVVVIIVTTVIGLGGLHHSIVGSIEVFAGLISSKAITLSDYMVFQVCATLGNAIGGVVFVSTIKYSHINAAEK